MTQLKTWVAGAAFVALAGAAQASLIDLGDGTVKDTNTNLIWLQDWNVNDRQTQETQKVWADGLDFAGSTAWRLPDIGEYSALGGAYGDLTKVAEFKNVVASVYWSASSGIFGSSYPYYFNVLDSSQELFPADGLFWAVAVRSADVAAAVPEPQTLALALLALGATAAARRARRT